MIVLLFLLAFLCCWGAKPCLEKEELADYLGVDYTQAVKGFFIVLVFFSHFNSYVSYTLDSDLIYLRVVNSFGQAMVTMFLFYSGFGVMESIRKKESIMSGSCPGTEFCVPGSILPLRCCCSRA